MDILERLRKVAYGEPAVCMDRGMAAAAVDEITRLRNYAEDMRLEIGVACETIGPGGDGTLLGRIESLLVDADDLRAKLERVTAERDEARRHHDERCEQHEQAVARAEKAEAQEAGLRKAIGDALALSANRERFVMMGPRAFSQVEDILRRALAGEKGGA